MIDVIYRTVSYMRHSFENMAAVTDSRERRRFQEIYRQPTLDMLRKVLDYVKLVKAGTDGSMTMNQLGDNTALTPVCDPTGVHFDTEEGFPMMPAAENREGLRKMQVEGVLREYLNAHYSE